MIRKCLASTRILVFQFHTLQMVDEKATLTVNTKIYCSFFIYIAGEFSDPYGK